jgi:TonB family protein
MKTLLFAVAFLAPLALSLSVAAQPRVYEAGPGITLPSVIKEVRPDYTQDAKSRGVQGSVWMKTVIATDGRPTDITVTKSLDTDLDAAALNALKDWEFKPGTKDGEPVPVRVTIEMTFKLK